MHMCKEGDTDSLTNKYFKDLNPVRLININNWYLLMPFKATHWEVSVCVREVPGMVDWSTYWWAVLVRWTTWRLLWLFLSMCIYQWKLHTLEHHCVVLWSMYSAFEDVLYCGGYHQYSWLGIPSIHWRSIVKNVQYCEGIPSVLWGSTISTVDVDECQLRQGVRNAKLILYNCGFPKQHWWYPPQYWTSSTVFITLYFPHNTEYHPHY